MEKNKYTRDRVGETMRKLPFFKYISSQFYGVIKADSVLFHFFFSFHLFSLGRDSAHLDREGSRSESEALEMNQQSLSILAGCFTAAAMIVFMDGLIVAKRSNIPYNFPMWLPQVLSMCGIFLMLFVETEYIVSQDREGDENEEIKAKCLFFFGCAFLFGSLFTSMWKLSDTYAETPNAWPGIALVVQSLLFLCCSITVFAIKRQNLDDDERISITEGNKRHSLLKTRNRMSCDRKNEERLENIKASIHAYLSDGKVYDSIRDIVESYLNENPQMPADNSDGIMKILKERGVIQSLLANVSAGDSTPSRYASSKWNLAEGEQYLHIRLNGGRAFVDNIETRKTKQQWRTFIALHFGHQRYRSEPQPCVCDPSFDDDFLFSLDPGIFGFPPNQLIEISTPLHIAVFREDTEENVSELIGENIIDWRKVLNTGFLGVTVELCGANAGVPSGILDLDLEIIPKTRSNGYTEEEVHNRLEQQRTAITAADREFLLYARRWWNEFQAFRPSHKNRKVKVFASTANGRMVPVTHFISPLQGEGLNSPLDAARFVSLIQNVKQPNDVQVIQGSTATEWLSPLVFLSQRQGHPSNHANLLCSLLLGFGLDAYCCMGTGYTGDLVMFVISRIGKHPPEVVVWDPLLGERHLSFYANCQQSSKLETTVFDFDNEELWKPLNPLKLRLVPKFPNAPLLFERMDPHDIERGLELRLRAAVTSHRDSLGIPTVFDENLSYVLSQALVKYEQQKVTCAGEDFSLFENCVKGTVGPGMTFKAIPVNVTNEDERNIMSICLSNDAGIKILDTIGEDVKFGIRAKIFVFPEGVRSVWVMIAASYRIRSTLMHETNTVRIPFVDFFFFCFFDCYTKMLQLGFFLLKGRTGRPAKLYAPNANLTTVSCDNEKAFTVCRTATCFTLQTIKAMLPFSQQGAFLFSPTPQLWQKAPADAVPEPPNADGVVVTNSSDEPVKIEPLTYFRDLKNAPAWLSEALEASGFPTTTPIQKYTIPVLEEGHDVIGLAPTGSGKTVAFAVPALKNYQNNTNSPSILVLAPTRELVQQTTGVFQKLSRGKVRVCEAYGGSPRELQARKLASGCDVVVACPGRLHDFLQRGEVSLENLSFLVFDEADRLLDMGFQIQLDEILNYMDPSVRVQKMMWSATWPQSVQRLAQTYLSPDRYVVRAGTAGTGLQVNKQISQSIIFAESVDDRIDHIAQLIESGKIDENTGKVIIFVERKTDTEEVAYSLSQKLGIDTRFVGVLHGGLQQRQRDGVMNQFKQSNVRLLVATDVASRGLDIPDVTCVINFEAPGTIDSYCHRIGRTGRAGRKGDAYTFIQERNTTIAPELVDYLQKAGVEVPRRLVEMGRRETNRRQYRKENFGDRRRNRNRNGGGNGGYRNNNKDSYGNYGNDYQSQNTQDMDLRCSSFASKYLMPHGQKRNKQKNPPTQSLPALIDCRNETAFDAESRYYPILLKINIVTRKTPYTHPPPRFTYTAYSILLQLKEQVSQRNSHQPPTLPTPRMINVLGYPHASSHLDFPHSFRVFFSFYKEREGRRRASEETKIITSTEDNVETDLPSIDRSCLESDNTSPFPSDWSDLRTTTKWIISSNSSKNNNNKKRRKQQQQQPEKISKTSKRPHIPFLFHIYVGRTETSPDKFFLCIAASKMQQLDQTEEDNSLPTFR
eukprot:gene4713-3405_t